MSDPPVRRALPQGRACIADCFVTGEWKESENASTLLAMDDEDWDEGDEVDGDFEDMETGEKHKAKPKEKDKEEEEEQEMPVKRGMCGAE